MYTPTDSCHYKNQENKCLTASGTVATLHRTIACPPKYPFFTKVVINNQEYVCEDRTAEWVQEIYGPRFDIFHDDYQEAKNWGAPIMEVIIYPQPLPRCSLCASMFFTHIGLSLLLPVVRIYRTTGRGFNFETTEKTMRVVKLVCGCGIEIERHRFDTDNKDYVGTETVTGMCAICDENDKNRKGFNHSPHWREKPVQLSEKTLAFLSKRLAETAERDFKDEYGDKPMSFKKKRAR